MLKMPPIRRRGKGRPKRTGLLPPPAVASTSSAFEEAPEMQVMVAEEQAAPVGRWQKEVEERLTKNDKMITEMHNMLQTVIQQTAPSGLGPDAAATSGLGPGAVSVGPASGLGPGAVSGGRMATGQGPEDQVGAVAPPWPSAEVLLPRATAGIENLQQGFASSALPIYGHISDKIKAKIWADEFIELAVLLQYKPERQQFALTMQHTDNESPVICVETNKKLNIGTIQRWQKAFEIFMAIYLLKASNINKAPQMLKYISTIRDLYESGGNWGIYDETFRSMMAMRDWQWDAIHAELWLKAAHWKKGGPPGKSAFQSKDRFVRGACFAFNQGKPCRTSPCRYLHKCKKCGGNHTANKCAVTDRNVRNTSVAATRLAK